MPVYQVIKANPDQYHRLINDEHLDFAGSIYYHPDFLTIAAESLQLKFEPLICLDGEYVAGIANFLLGGKSKIKSISIPRLFQYFGPIAFNDNKVIYDTMIHSLESDVDLAIFCSTPDQIYAERLTNWKRTQRITYYLQPDNFENMKKKCSDDVRNKVNKAIKSNVQIKTTGVFPYDLYKASFNRQNILPPLGKNQLTFWVEKVMAIKLAVTFVALVDNNPVAFRTQLSYGHYAYDWLAGAIPEFNQLGVNQLLMLKIGEYLHNNGIANWDLTGGDIKSIGNFKKSFGSIPKPHLQLERAFTLKGKLYRKLIDIKARSHD